MAISAIIRRADPGEDPRNPMLISSGKIQSKQLYSLSSCQVTNRIVFYHYLIPVLHHPKKSHIFNHPFSDENGIMIKKGKRPWWQTVY